MRMVMNACFTRKISQDCGVRIGFAIFLQVFAVGGLLWPFFFACNLGGDKDESRTERTNNKSKK